MRLKSLMLALAGLVLAACNATAKTFTAVEGDASIGGANAAVTVVEYGAPTCPACLAWHDQTWKQLKSTYIDTGKIKFVFRPLPSHNPPVDAAIASIARCAGAENFFGVIDEAFARHQAIEEATGNGTVQAELVSLGKKFGMSEAQVQTCVRDPAGRERILEVQKLAQADGVSGTPTFLVNGRQVRDPSFRSLAQAIDAAQAASAPAAPAAAPAATPAVSAPANQ